MLIYFVWGWLLLSCLLTVGMVGKPRKVITPGVAVTTIILAILMGVGAYFVR